MLLRVKWWFLQRKTRCLIVFLIGLLMFFGQDFLSMSARGFERTVGQYSSNSSTLHTSIGVETRQLNATNENQQVTAEKTDSSTVSVLLTSYMRSGSSFLGELLGFQDNAFYWYEPVWNFHAHYVGRDVICPGFDPCRKTKPGDRPVSVVLDRLSQFYRCNLSAIKDAVFDTFTDLYSGSKWRTFTTCRKIKRGPAYLPECLDSLRPECTASKYRVAKVIRLTVDNAEQLLEDNPDLKVVHLYRDPRAIVNSRITTTWHILKESPKDGHAAVRADAKELCDRMRIDFLAGLELKRRFPRRFSFVFYEDFVDHLEYKVGLLYTFLGMDSDAVPPVMKMIKMKGKHTKKGARDKPAGFSGWWRNRLQMDVINVIDSVCSDVYKSLGYIQISQTSDLLDLQHASYNFSESYTLEYIHKYSLNYNDD